MSSRPLTETLEDLILCLREENAILKAMDLERLPRSLALKSELQIACEQRLREIGRGEAIEPPPAEAGLIQRLRTEFQRELTTNLGLLDGTRKVVEGVVRRLAAAAPANAGDRLRPAPLACDRTI